MNDHIARIDNWIKPLAARGIPFKLARVGGSVRDEILGRKSKDADYVAFGVGLSALGDCLTGFALGEGGCSITPLRLRDGRQAGWRIFKKGYGLVEIMLPRTEVSTGPGHRDFKIVLDQNLTPEQDALRRDFTFNALYKWIVPDESTLSVFAAPYSILDNITDPTGRGLYDLQHKLINTTHPDSFRDDPLRILRALRFVSTLGYDLGSNTVAQMIEHAEAAHGLSQAYKRDALEMGRFDGSVSTAPAATTEAASGTVLTEMSKLLMGDDVGKALRLMRDSGVMAVVFPEWAPLIGHAAGSKYHDLDSDEHTIVALEAAAKANAPLAVRWSLLWHDVGKPETEWLGLDNRKHYYEPSDRVWSEFVANSSVALNEPKPQDHEVVSERIWRSVCKRLNVPKDLREDAALLIRNHMVTLQPKNAGVKVRRWRVAYGDEMLSNLLLHRACDCMGKQRSASAQLQLLGKLVRAQESAIESGVPSSVKDLKIDGKDVLDKGLWGAAVGGVLKGVLDEVVCQPDEQKTGRDWQMTAIDRWIDYYRKGPTK